VTLELDKIKTAVRAVLEDGSNQHQYPYLLVGKVMAAIDNPVSVAVVGDGRKIKEVVDDNSRSFVMLVPNMQAEQSTNLDVQAEQKPKLTKAERIAKMQAGRAAKSAAKKAAAASQTPVDKKVEPPAAVQA